jgi:hypothetical protein
MDFFCTCKIYGLMKRRSWLKRQKQINLVFADVTLFLPLAPPIAQVIAPATPQAGDAVMAGPRPTTTVHDSPITEPGNQVYGRGAGVG